MLFDNSLTAQLLIKFMARLIEDAGRKVFLILDNLRVHHATKVRAWLEDRTDEIEVFYLPAYSPELNPDEYLNCDMKAGVHGKPPARNRKKLPKRIIGHMRKLQKLPTRIVRYFKHPKIAYAAP
jgi:transposase